MSDIPIFRLLPKEPALRDKLSSSFHERLLDSLHDGVYFVDRERKIQYWNKGAELLTGYAASEVIGKSCSDNILMHVSEEGCALCVEGCPLADTIADGKRRETEAYLRHKLGHRIPVSIRAAPILDSEGQIIGAAEVFSDLTAKKRIERRVGELENIAFLDSLTGVPNRRYMEMKIKQAIQEAEVFGRRIGLLMIDIDGFKEVNDLHGHEVGDDALRAVCLTLAHSLRTGDFVGRWGGDELVVVVKDISVAALGAFAERCRMLISESAIPAGDAHLKVTVSAGATLVKRGDTSNEAIKRADEMLYRSKASGRNRVTID